VDNKVPRNFSIVDQFRLHQFLGRDRLFDDRRHVGVGLTYPGISLNFRGSGKTQRLREIENQID
jgi:hypothetical protein